MAVGAALGTVGAGAALGTKAALGTAGLSALGKSALLAGGATAVGALPDIIPSKFEREQRKRLRELQRKQELGLLGLTERERAALESQMRGARQQAQQYSDAERARLTQQSAQPQMALLGQQMADESRQRLEADLASEILRIDLVRQAQQEQEIKDLQAAQGQYARARTEGLVAPVQSGLEAYSGQMALDRMLGSMSPEQQKQAMNMMFMQRMGQSAQGTNLFAPRPGEISMRQAASMYRPIETYTYEEMLDMGMTEREINEYFYNLGANANPALVKNASVGDVPALDGRQGIYGGE